MPSRFPLGSRLRVSQSGCHEPQRDRRRTVSPRFAAGFDWQSFPSASLGMNLPDRMAVQRLTVPSELTQTMPTYIKMKGKDCYLYFQTSISKDNRFGQFKTATRELPVRYAAFVRTVPKRSA